VGASLRRAQDDSSGAGIPPGALNIFDVTHRDDDLLFI
jgi:hypothetical protein